MKHHYYFSFIFLLVSTAYSQSVPNDSLVIKNETIVQDNSQFRYYYYPNLIMYYDTQDDIYLCMEKEQWVKRHQLPSNFRGYSMNNSVYVLIKGYMGDTPNLFIDQHKKDFPANFKSKKKPNVIVKK